jgi:hypothetical protein
MQHRTRLRYKLAFHAKQSRSLCLHIEQDQILISGLAHLDQHNETVVPTR